MARRQGNFSARCGVLFLFAVSALLSLELSRREHGGGVHDFPIGRKVIGEAELAGARWLGWGRRWALRGKRDAGQEQDGRKMAWVHGGQSSTMGIRERRGNFGCCGASGESGQPMGWRRPRGEDSGGMNGDSGCGLRLRDGEPMAGERGRSAVADHARVELVVGFGSGLGGDNGWRHNHSNKGEGDQKVMHGSFSLCGS